MSGQVAGTLVRYAATVYYRLGSLPTEMDFSQFSGWESKIKVPSEPGSSEASLLGLHCCLSLHLHLVMPLWVAHILGVCLCLSLCSSLLLMAAVILDRARFAFCGP